MSVDISRVSFDPSKHFSRLIHQQGRVTLDVDANEQAAVLLHYVRTAVADILGPAAVPQAAPGFAVTRVGGDPGRDLAVGPGRLYVDGMLVENDAATTYLTQPDAFVDVGNAAVPDGQPFVAFLRCWEREITAIQDPSIREVALGETGPDTAGRARVVWQVALLPFDGDEDPGAEGAADRLRARLDELVRPAALMAARARHEPSAPVAACTIAPEARFRGPENQLYRVQIHASGVGGLPAAAEPGRRVSRAGGRRGAAARAAEAEPTATFVWSRENGSVALPVVSVAGTLVTVESWGRDGTLGLDVGDWVELVDDSTAVHEADEMPTAPPQLIHEVVAIDVPGRIVTLDAEPNTAPPGGQAPMTVSGDPALHPYLRRWDHRPREGARALPVVLDTWIALEDGIEVRFTNPAPEGEPTTPVPGRFRRGDHWLVPARTIPGDVLWPQDDDGPAAVPPHGVVYHYTPLAYVPTGDGDPVPLVPTFEPRFP